jgi:hypothetical protein
MKKETKERFKNVWIEASPYIATSAVFLGAVATAYTVDANKRTKTYQSYMAQRTADSRRTADAFIAAENRKARKKNES